MPRADSLPPTPDSPPALEPAELLHYLPTYRVLICRLCQYAIQPAAIPRHLKDLHHIYRSNRRPFMEYVSQFTLADPQDVVPPNSHECPVEILPIEEGVACNAKGCGHLCVTVKRMKSHWSSVHHEMGQEGTSWRNVKLQTFFRGNQLQYFEVGHDHLQLVKERSCPRGRIVQFDDSGSESSPISINFSESSDLDFMLSYDDLELLHHFTTSTYATVGNNPQMSKVWQTAAPELAKHQPFLMYGILACSALHLAHLHPEQSPQLTLRAANYQDKALAGFRKVVINGVNADNCHAVFAFTNLLIIYVFASEEHQEMSLLLVTPNKGGSLPLWLQFIRNGCVMLCHVWDDIENGPMTPLILEHEGSQGCSSDLRYWESLKFSSVSLLSFIPPSDSPLAWTERESVVYVRSAVGLGKTFESVGQLQSLSTWDAMHMWPLHVSDYYMTMLNDWHPGALILLAHFCVLLKRLESEWYFRDRATKMLSLIYSRLSDDWRWTLQWPMEQLGLR